MEIMPSSRCLEKSCQAPSTNRSELAAANLHRERAQDVSLHIQQHTSYNNLNV
jgi:hypothetical protein